ncbi:MAG: tRNA lysidine(34) synthetase TilS, partial [Bacilli bacterium]|nr:tRNA lysidine(34) synthetase TilS [Bacilli bacterium]
MNNLFNSLLDDFFKKNNLDIKNKKFIIGVSTGVDSSVLLDLFIKNKNIDNNNIIVCHVNHHKREESAIEEEYIKKYCLDNNLKLYVKELYFDEEKDNFQSLARTKRLEFFKNVIEKENGSFLVLAHHLQDLAETIILRISRGSSLAGYAGINECYYNDNYYLIRPLININKDEIYEYAKSNNITYFEDSSNDSDLYTRNKIRHNVIPSLVDLNSDILTKFKEFSDVLFNASSVINDIRDEFIKDNVSFNNKNFSFSRNVFNSLNSYMQEEVLFELLKPNNLSEKNILELLKIIHSNKSNFSLIFKNKFEITLEYDLVLINYDYKKNNENVSILIKDIGNYPVSDNLSIFVTN